MSIRRKIIVSTLIAVSVITFSTQSWAKWTETQNGTTYECESIKSWQCKADARGNQYDCHMVDKTKCTAISGPGSGKPLHMGNFGIVGRSAGTLLAD